MKKVFFILTISSIFLFCEVKTEVKTGEQKVEEIIKYEGPKARIAVARFDVKSPKATKEMGEGLRDMLIDALFKSGKFIVLEKGDTLKELEEEFNLKERGWSQKAPEKGSFEAADIIVVGAITGFEPYAEGQSGGGVVIPLPFGGGFAIKKEEAYIQANIRLIDVRTRRIINSTRVEGKASKTKTGILGGGVVGGIILGGGFEKYKNTPTEEAVMIMIDNAVKEIARLVPDEYYKYGSKESVKGYKNEPEGFRGIKWETSPSSISNLKLIKTNGNYKEYIKTDDTLQIGKAKIERILYSFYKDQMEKIIIEVKGKENFDYLKETTFEKFGEGNKISENEWVWKGNITSMVLRYDNVEGKGILEMSSEIMKKRIDADTGF